MVRTEGCRSWPHVHLACGAERQCVAPVSGRSRWHAYVVPHPPLRRSTALSETGGVAGIVAAVLLSFSIDARARADADATHVTQQFAQLVAETISATLGGPAMGTLADEIRTVSTCLADRARPVEPPVPAEDPHHCGGMLRRRARRGTSSRRTDCRRAADRAAAGASGFRDASPHDPAAAHPAPAGPPVYSSPSPGSVVAPTNGRVTSTFGDGRGHQGMDIGNDLGGHRFSRSPTAK